MTFHLTQILNELNSDQPNKNELPGHEPDLEVDRKLHHDPGSPRFGPHSTSSWSRKWGSASAVLQACLWRGRDQITSALARVQEGAYGCCLHCGKEIDLRRLDAIPWRQLCIVCQEKMEPPA
ncbi:MAG TPA: TraR/DksA family transcriptional regulator [Candidatus Sulfotelmatobacter sp.]|jgi:hypothetical protein